MSEWEFVQGFRSAAKFSEKRAWRQDIIQGDFKLSTDVELITGNGYGIWFRTDSEAMSGYCFQYDAGFNGGSLVLNKWCNGAQKQIAVTPFSGPWHNLSRQIEIKAIDYEISASLDGLEVIRRLDSQYQSGKVGLRLWDGSEAIFENIVVIPIGSIEKAPNSTVTGLNQQQHSLVKNYRDIK